MCDAVSITGVERMPSGSTLPQPTCAATFVIGRAEVARPQHAAVVRVERVHRVVLGRGEHAPVEDERLCVDRGVERSLPGLVRGKQLRLGRVVARALRVAVDDRPGRAGEGRRGSGGEHQCERGGENGRAAETHSGKSGALGGGENVTPGYPARRHVEIEVTMPLSSTDHYTIISADCHAGASHETVPGVPRRAVSRRLRRLAGKYRNPFSDLRGNRRMRNWDDELRNSQLEADGIVGEVVFPNTVPPFFPSFVLFARPPKPDEYEHRLAGIRAHNRWLADWCARFPERRAGIGQIFLNDVDDAIDDVNWINEHGLRGGVLISAIPPDVDYVKPLYDPVYEPLWSVCEDLGVKVNSHGGTGLPNYGKYAVADLLYITEVSFYSQRPFVQLLLSGVFERHPRLQFVMTGDGLRVAAADARTLRPAHQEDQHDRVDGRAALHRRAQAAAARERLLPPELLGRRQPARTGRRAARDVIGLDKFMWGSDYPHDEGTWPFTREHLRQLFHDTDPGSCSSCSQATRPGSTTSRSTRSRRSPTEFGPTVAELSRPLDVLPEHPNEALLKAVGGTRP